MQDPKEAADSQAGRDDEETAGEPVAVRTVHRVDRLLDDQPRHDHRLAGSRDKLDVARSSNLRDNVRRSEYQRRS